MSSNGVCAGNGESYGRDGKRGRGRRGTLMYIKRSPSAYSAIKASIKLHGKNGGNKRGTGRPGVESKRRGSIYSSSTHLLSGSEGSPLATAYTKTERREPPWEIKNAT